jgi:hypothetical protein
MQGLHCGVSYLVVLLQCPVDEIGLAALKANSSSSLAVIYRIRAETRLEMTKFGDEPL